MGWLSARSSPRLDCDKVRVFRLTLYLLLGLMLGMTVTLASAASYSNTTTKGMKGNGWNGSGTMDAGRTAQTIESVNVGGKYIPVPMLGSVGAAALEAVIIGLKASPKALVIGGAINYLGNKGITLMGDELKVKDPATQPYSGGVQQFQSVITGVSTQYNSPSAWACKTAGSSIYNSSRSCPAGLTALGATACADCSSGSGSWIDGMKNNGPVAQPKTCPTDFVLAADGSICLSTKYIGPSESDWAKVRNDPAPAEVMKELCQNLSKLGSNSYACPVTGQQAQTTTEPLSSWKTDPLTGQQTRQVVKISPAPTTENPERVEIATETETKTTTTNPTTGETTETVEKKKDENTDFCVLHPDSIACAKLGDIPDDPAFDPTNKDVSITRQDWGAADGSCPNDLSYTLKLTGTNIGMSYKPVCDGLRMFRPVIIGMGWLAAVFAFLGIARKAQS